MKAKKIQDVRVTIIRLLEEHKASEFDQVQPHYLPTDNRRRATDNCVATLKPICDAIAA